MIGLGSDNNSFSIELQPQITTMLQGPNSARKSESDASGSAVGVRVGKKETFEDREMVFG